MGRFVRDAANGHQLQVHRGGRILPLLDMNPLAEDDCAVERKTGLGAVPRDELPYRLFVRALPGSLHCSRAPSTRTDPPTSRIPAASRGTETARRAATWAPVAGADNVPLVRSA